MNTDQIDYSCKKTWRLFKEGLTKGVFQFETNLSRQVLKKIKPETVYDLAICNSILRPGPLKAGYVEQYAAVKNGKNEIHKVGNVIADAILGPTLGFVIFQETIMLLGRELAWKDLEEKEKLLRTDKLRKAIGKKNQDEVNKIGEDFRAGCIKNGLDEKTADELLKVIKTSGRYAFNASHAISYADLAYKTAYLKANYPLQFIASYLTYSKYKLDQEREIQEIYDECQKLNIQILGPNINSKNLGFKIEGDSIRYGLRNIKYFGGKDGKLIKNLPHFTKWQQVIILGLTDMYGIKLPSPTMEALISTGAFRDIKLSRKSLLNIYNFFRKIKPREQEYLLEKFADTDTEESFRQLVESCIKDICNSKQAEILSAHLKSFNMNEFDHPAWVEEMENYYLAIPITATSVDGKDNHHFDTCHECTGEGHKPYTKKTVAVVLKEIKESVIKNGNLAGQKMAKASIYDATGTLDHLPLFPDAYAEFSDLLIPKNTLAFTIMWNKKGWIVEKVSQI